MKTKPSFVIYNASAGSGKTFAIVKTYLSLLFASPRNDTFRSILAITFTNKAVAEMKTRIVESLVAFSENPIPKDKRALLQAVSLQTGLSEEEVSKKAKKVLKSLAHNYAAFQVSTIDAFTNRILRTFAKDLGLSSNFEVELDVDSILNEAVDRLILRAGNDKLLTKTLVEYAISKADDDKSWDISRDLYSIAKLLTNENHQASLAKLQEKELHDFNSFSKKLQVEILRLEEEIRKITEVFFQLLEKNNLENSDFTRSSLPNYFLKLQAKKFEKLFGAKWQETIEEANLYPQKIAEEKKACIDDLQSQIAQLFITSKKLIWERKFQLEIKKNLVQLSLLNSIRQEVIQLCDERNLLLISDFNKTIEKSVKNQPAPFIYERLGERYQNYFIDEFQDTSQLQWENLVPLIDSALSSENEEGEVGGLTLVGDAKQAIYRWRGGKAEQFMGISVGKSPFSTSVTPMVLESNYRSLSEIVNFNNRFFQYVSTYLKDDTHRNLYENASQIVQKGNGGFVNISFVKAENNAEKEVFYSTKVLEIIQGLCEKGFSKKEICILVRKQKQGIVMANFLSENNIQIISSETLLLKRSLQVQFAVSFLEWDLEKNELRQKAQLLSLLSNFIDNLPDQHEFISKGLPLEPLEFIAYLNGFGFDFDLSKLESMPLYNAVEYLLRSFNLLQTSDAYIQFFLDFVFTYSQNNQGGLAGFLEHWEQKKEKLSIVVPEGQDAIQIMTIHKAKGLEFPIVIYPYADEVIDDLRKDSCWIDLKPPFNDIPVAWIKASSNMPEFGEEPALVYQDLLLQKELDAMNLLYVACTRPKEQLYIITEYIPEKKVEEKINNFSKFFREYLIHIGKWEGELLNYDFGILQPNPIGKAEPILSENNETFISTSPSSHNLSISSRSGSLWETERELAIDFGDQLHAIMGNIYHTHQLEQVFQQITSESHLLPKEVENFRNIVEGIIHHPQLKKYYEEGVYCFNEREIIDQGEILRPDRINIEGNSVTIIDYKTGIELSKHELQVQRYSQAIKNMGYEVVNKLLIYVNDEVKLKFV